MFTPSRLTLARRRRGMTLVALSNAIDRKVKPRTISAYECGDNAPTEETVQEFARVLRFPREFFDAPELVDASVNGVSFRALTRMTASQRDAAIAAGTLVVALNEWLSERFSLPTEDIAEVLPAMIEPNAAAKLVRAHWGLGEQPIGNLIYLLEAHGVRVFSLTEDCEEVDAFSFWHHGTPFMCLNTRKTAEHSRFDAAHELGHLVMHRYGGSPRGRQEELEANRFASAFLMPREDVLASAPRFPSFESLVIAKKRWNVSVAALNYRLHQIDAISEWHYRELCIDISKYGRKREPNPSPREHSQVLAKAFNMLRHDGVSRADVARELCLYLEDLEALMFRLVTSGIDGGQEAESEPRGRLRLVEPSHQ